MQIDPTKPADGVLSNKGDLRANLQAARDGITGAGQISTTGTPFTIDEGDYGSSMDYWLVWNAAGAASVTLGTGVAFGKTFQVTRLGAGNITVNATNVVTGSTATTTLHDSLVFRSLGNNTWVRIQAA